jgi:Protein kinase domain
MTEINPHITLREYACKPGVMRLKGRSVLILILVLACFMGAVLPVSAQGTEGSPGYATPLLSADARIHFSGDSLPAPRAGSPRSASLTPVPARVSPSANPVVFPIRANRTAILSALAKNAAERPKVTVPLFWFVVVIAIAIAGLGLFFYLFLWRRPPRNNSPPSSREDTSGNATVIDGPSRSRVLASGPAAEATGPGIQFPPSLEKRFPHAEFIGEGGLARVFRAYDPRLQKTVAVKVPIRFDEVTGTHFTRDILFWQGLHHENIIEMYSSNILPVPYVEMEYAPGSLAQLPFPLPQERALAIIHGIARGLAYAHERGVIHRDIKPENILLAENGTPKITDWGLGREISDTRQSSVLGYSPVYAAPEQIAPGRFGRPGPATDVYQLGVIMYELLVGTVPFSNEGMHDLSLAILNDAPAVPEFAGRDGKRIRAIILRCLEKNPADRYASIALFLADLGDLIDHRQN